MKINILTIENAKGIIEVWEEAGQYGVTAQYHAYPFPIEIDSLTLEEAMTFTADFPINDSPIWDTLGED